jgi:hypothetical protein
MLDERLPVLKDHSAKRRLARCTECVPAGRSSHADLRRAVLKQLKVLSSDSAQVDD